MHQTEDVEALAARVAALGTVWREAREGGADSLRSVRRIARSLETPLEVYGAPEVLRLARRVSSADDDELAGLVPRLLDGLRESLGELPRDQTRILVVEDEEEEAELLRRILDDPSREFDVAPSADEAGGFLREEAPDLIILDLTLPDGDGRDVLVQVRDGASNAATPVLILSGRADPSVRAECFALGADEFLEKPAEPEILRAAVASLLRRTAALRRLAQEDHLTSLPNRAAFSRIFLRLQALAERNDQPLSLALLDVDYLKEVNDRYGHPVGDDLLRDLSRVVQEALRDSDVLARWGGDEFVILLPDTDVAGAEEAVEKARRRFRKRVQATADLDVQNGMSFSAGVTSVGSAESVEESVARADHLLYRAKSAGRNGVLAGEPAVRTEERDVLVVEDEDPVARILVRFLERDGFRPRRAATGEDALDGARERRPDLVVLDVMLPGKDGFEVLREMREDPELQDVPVLMITALGQEEAVVRGFKLGVDEYLVKPVSREEFLSRVRRLVRPG